MAAESVWQDNANINYIFEIEAVHNLELDGKAAVEELSQWVEEVKKAMEYTYISDTDE